LKANHRFRDQAEQHWLFFRQWMRAPLSTASVVPSSRYLAERMVAEVPRGAKRVVELGAGTGVFTKALLARGIEELMVVELNAELAEKLRSQFRQARVITGDAGELRELAQKTPGFEQEQVDAVVSGLGFLNMPNALIEKIVSSAFDVLAPGAPFIQFTYGPKAPINDDIVKSLGLRVRRAGFTLRNFPPASVYVFQR
jgi:phosphatidylethanolamine/phosphatidyl-N-methylethanolamine N-methyltransferase